MNVQLYDGIFRYLVESESRPGHGHLVDLAEHGGIGRCACEQWSCRIWPRIRDGQLPVDLEDPQFACRHIRAARAHMFELLFFALMEREPDQTQHT